MEYLRQDIMTYAEDKLVQPLLCLGYFCAVQFYGQQPNHSPETIRHKTLNYMAYKPKVGVFRCFS